MTEKVSLLQYRKKHPQRVMALPQSILGVKSNAATLCVTQKITPLVTLIDSDINNPDNFTVNIITGFFDSPQNKQITLNHYIYN